MFDFFLQTAVNYARTILPWFFIGIIAAFGVEKFIRPKLIKKYFGEVSVSKIIFSLILGMVSPLSIMSFLPVVNEFISLGFNSSLLFSFLVAERAYDLQSFFIVTSLFGFKEAILNAIAILISLIAVVYSLRKNQVEFAHPNSKKTDHFWFRQLKLMAIVAIGIGVGAFLRVIIPQNQFQSIAGSPFGGLATAIILGFVLYFGPILGNYPVAKAFAELGMSPMGVLGFLTIAPVFNFVIIMLFGSAVGFKNAVKAIAIYTVTATVLTVLFTYLFL